MGKESVRARRGVRNTSRSPRSSFRRSAAASNCRMAIRKEFKSSAVSAGVLVAIEASPPSNQRCVPSIHLAFCRETLITPRHHKLALRHAIAWIYRRRLRGHPLRMGDREYPEHPLVTRSPPALSKYTPPAPAAPQIIQSSKITFWRARGNDSFRPALAASLGLISTNANEQVVERYSSCSLRTMG